MDDEGCLAFLMDDSLFGVIVDVKTLFSLADSLLVLAVHNVETLCVKLFADGISSFRFSSLK